LCVNLKFADPCKNSMTVFTKTQLKSALFDVKLKHTFINKSE
jgi:hypothetical protein